MPTHENRPTEGETVSEEFGGSGDQINIQTTLSGSTVVGPASMPKTMNGIIQHSTERYLTNFVASTFLRPCDVEERLLAETNAELRLENIRRVEDLDRRADANEKNQLFLLKELSAWQIAAIVAHLHHVIRIRPARGSSDPDRDLLAVYKAAGHDAGLYVSSETDLRATMRLYCGGMDDRKFRLARDILYEQAPRRTVTVERDLFAVNNGIVDYASKQLLEFTPELVFLSKSSVDFDPSAENPIIDEPDGSTWDVLTWIEELSDDEGVSALLWQLQGAVLRTGVRWNKAAFPYSEKGNNGKGTWLELLRNIVGEGRYVSLPLDEMGKDFMLEPLTRASAILTDENNVGFFIDKAANFKAIVTNDVLHINGKGKAPISYQFMGFMVQCLNELPRFRDKSESLYRRQLFVPFRKWFGGAENKNIKTEYLQRPDVLRFVLKHIVLGVPEYYELDVPAVCQEVLNEFKRENDSVRDFWLEFEKHFAWGLLPAEFLYDVYKAWSAKTRPGLPIVMLNPFRRAIERSVEHSTIWMKSTAEKTRPGLRMAAPEPLTMRFDLQDWMSSHYTGSDPVKRSIFDRPSANYRWCLVPRSLVSSACATDDDDSSD